MSDAKEVYDFDVNEYERPNRKWICGRSAEGTPCPLGPSPSGQCGAVCEPYKAGDRYYCGNATMLAGKCDQGPQENGACGLFPAQCRPTKKDGRLECSRGKCDPGPLPDGRCSQHFAACRPVRSVLAKRRVFSLFCLASAIGVALIMVAGPMRTGMIAPGPLTSQHRATEKGCAACHVVGEGSLNDWICAATDASETGIVQSKLCLECHGELNPHALSPHSTAPASLAAISERISDGPAASDVPLRLAAARAVFGLPNPHHKQFACATCHQEHHGSNFDLKHMSDQQCQSCHIEMFEGFDQGHPEFSDYPYSRRTRIYFDHQSHYDRHFYDFKRTMPSGEKPNSCLSCHQLDSAGENVSVRGFDQSCASCHQRQIQGDLLPELVLAALPSLDVESLAGAGVHIGQWPANRDMPDVVSTGGRLPAVMDLLLSADPRYVQNRETVEKLRLWALDGADRDQLHAVEDYVWAIKELWHDLANPDPRPLHQRLRKAFGPDLSAEQISQLVATLRTDKFAAAARKWLPQLDAEIKAAGSGRLAETNAIAAPSPTSVEPVARYIRDDSNLSVRYRPTEHADQVLRRWLDSSARTLSRTDSTGRLFTSLTDPTTTGRCTKCHTVDQQDDRAVVNWLSARPGASVRNFTKFTHRPHLELLGGEACQQCHKLKQDSDTPVTGYRREFFAEDWNLQTNPHHFSSNFESLPKSTCTNCHNPTAVQDSCLSCHNYHVR